MANKTSSKKFLMQIRLVICLKLYIFGVFCFKISFIKSQHSDFEFVQIWYTKLKFCTTLYYAWYHYPDYD